jgi:hypothetical protein
MALPASPRVSRLAHLRELRLPRLPARAALPAAGFACLAALVVAADRQRSCFATAPASPCRSDIRVLYGLRALASHAFPYVHPWRFGLPHGTVEYPVLTGLFAWACARVVTTGAAFMVLTVALLGAVALATTASLYRRFGLRCLMFAAAPTLALSAFQNWDLLAVAATVGGLLAYSRRRPAEAAAWFAVGACLKVYPALFLIVLLAEHWQLGWRAVGRIAFTAAAVAAVVAGPFLLVWRGGLFEVVGFQDSRPDDISGGSLWAAFAWRLPLGLINLGALLALLAALAVTLQLASQVRDRTGSYPFLQACAVLTFALILTSKASSPQYSLWILPFFVFLRVRPAWWWLFAATDIYFHQTVFGVLAAHPDFLVASQSPALVAAIVIRSALLVVFTVAFWRSASTPSSDAFVASDARLPTASAAVAASSASRTTAASDVGISVASAIGTTRAASNAQAVTLGQRRRSLSHRSNSNAQTTRAAP